MSGSALLDDPSEHAVPCRRPGSEWTPLPFEQPLVLVVDDDEGTRDTLTVLLERAGVAVLQAGTADEALSLARSEQVSLVILDVMLPDSSGFEVCRLLRDDERTRRVRVIMLTALTGVTDEVTGILAGADAYIVKPARRAELIRRLSDLL